MKLKIVNISENKLPKYETTGSSGLDLLTNNDEDIVLKSLERTLVPTGLFVEIPKGFEGQVRARSGLSIKHGITLINGIGTIDSDYRGELKIPVVNLSTEDFTIKKGLRIAQLVIIKHERVELEEVKTLSDTSRGHGGFGSTGVN
ncbi:dUTP diphosphatase [Helicovermis profundi]|uniref:Deoxyuridine 5'-triphosphate nucleotidohydrolase n=1 Tax=Helicovermis profundi TaxID=3065157 RepID=A0AAU9ES92_9FIRM|nr:dUTP diphosphatase [Clostridia bacterium S502]